MNFRLARCLKRAQIIFIGELVQKKPYELLKIRNFGRKALAEVNKLLEGFAKTESVQLELKMDVQGWQRPVQQPIARRSEWEWDDV